MSYQDYKEARDAAWAMLLNFNIRELPIKISEICKACHFHLRSYQSGAKYIEMFGLEAQCRISDGFTKLYQGQYYIFYNNDMSVARKRFTVAHELGHIVLGHLQENGVTQVNREPDSKDNPIETAANVFASRLLAPACVLHELNMTAPEEIAELCGISLQAATFRAQRMNVLEERNKFGVSPLEREVQRNFKPFIRRQRRG